jgi:hypothetical protein
VRAFKVFDVLLLSRNMPRTRLAMTERALVTKEASARERTLKYKDKSVPELSRRGRGLGQVRSQYD